MLLSLGGFENILGVGDVFYSGGTCYGQGKILLESAVDGFIAVRLESVA